MLVLKGENVPNYNQFMRASN